MAECGAKKRSGGECHAPAMRGQKRCARHGGKSPQAKAAADRRLQEQKAQAELEKAAVTLGLPQDIDPGKALLDEIARTYGIVQWLQAKVRELEPDELIWGKVSHREGVGPEGPVDVTEHKADFHAYYQLYLAERKHLVAVSAAALKAGIEERKIRIAESQGDMVAAALRRIFDALGLTAEQAELLPIIVPRELRALSELPV